MPKFLCSLKSLSSWKFLCPLLMLNHSRILLEGNYISSCWGFFPQLMLQCVLEFLTEFVLRFYSKRLFWTSSGSLCADKVGI